VARLVINIIVIIIQNKSFGSGRYVFK